MGNTGSAFKDLFQRLVRRQRCRDRWVRDDTKTLLPDEAEKRTTHRNVQRRIDDKVYDQLLEQEIPKRRPEDRDLSIHDDLHRRQMAILHCASPSSYSNQPSSSMAESFDSMASYVMKGTESKGVNFYSMETEVKKKKTKTSSSMPYTTESDDEETVRDHYDRIKWKRRFTDDAGRPISPKADTGEKNSMPAFDDEEGSTTDEDNAADENREYEDNADVEELMVVAAEQNEFVLERFEVLVNTCNSFDASWCNDILLS